MQAWFSVSDNTAACQIKTFNLYTDPTTPMTATTNPDLWAILAGSTYTGTGPININTNYDAATINKAAIGVDWYIQAEIAKNLVAVTAPIRISIVCNQVTQVTSTYNPSNGNAFISQLTGYTFAFTIQDNSAIPISTVNMPSVLTYTVNQNLCGVENFSLVTDETGTQPYSNSLYNLNAQTGVLTITSSTMANNDLFIKASSYNSGASKIDKIKTLVCGSQTFSQTASAPIFNIVRDQTVTSTWEAFAVIGAVSISPTFCPMSSVRACAVSDCSTLLNTNEFKITTDANGQFQLEVELSVARDTTQ